MKPKTTKGQKSGKKLFKPQKKGKPKAINGKAKKKDVKEEVSDEELSFIDDEPMSEDELLASDQEVENEGNLFDEEENEESVDSDEEVEDEETFKKKEKKGDEANKHKKSLEKLKNTDPEFYKFLKENDENLLNFNVSDEESGSENEQEEDDENRHVVPSGEELEKASDESDFEEEDAAPKDKKLVTLKLLKQWTSNLKTDKSNQTITQVIHAFHAALRTVSSEGDDEVQHYKVEGSAVFNSVISLCVLELGPAIRNFLGLTSGSQSAHKARKFAKVKSLLRGYFHDLLKLLGCVTSSNILTVLLKHLHYMTSFLSSFPPVLKPFLKKLIQLWGTAEESVRVVAFLCILRITHRNQKMLLNDVLKKMHMTYTQNCKFVSVKTLACINFMRRSLVEMFSLDLGIAYEHMFLYTRQMAILVRSAIINKTTENTQAVYNWQFVNNLRLWSNLLSSNYNKPQLEPLIYPFTQLCIGTINLVPTTQFYPLRFHIVQILIELCGETGVFINPIPFLIEVLDGYDFNKPHQKASMKPLNFTCILRASKSQMQESGFKDTILDTIYNQLLEYCSLHSGSLAFPELTLIIIITIKKFVSKCKKANYCSKMKQLLEKIDQNSKAIEKHRNGLSGNIRDLVDFNRIENDLRSKGMPLTQYYESWKKLQSVKKKRQATETDEISDFKLPTVKKGKKKVQEKADEDEDDGEVELFPSDSEDEEMAIEQDV